MKKSQITTENLTHFIEKSINYIKKLSSDKQDEIINLLKQVRTIQNSDLNKTEKKKELKKILWDNQTTSKKLLIGAFFGSLIGLFVFGTSGIGIAAFGSASGIYGFLTGTFGGTFISSIIQNFEKNE